MLLCKILVLREHCPAALLAKIGFSAILFQGISAREEQNND
jgi:hypothetical protein